MVGIKSYGVYIPYHRVKRAEIGEFWGSFQLPGEKAVANFDEDAVTMGVEACRDCLVDFDRERINGLYFASTTFPYSEKQSSALAAGALDLDQSALTIDISGTLRSGSNAIRAALDAVRAESLNNVLVCSSDLRLGLPTGGKELEFGDGAAALLVGDSDLIATIDNVYSLNTEIYSVYRPSEERFVSSWEERFVREIGYMGVVSAAVRGALEKFGMSPADFTKGIFSAPNPTYLKGVAKKLGFDPKSQAIDPIWQMVGNCGAAHAMILLAAALEEANPGDKLLFVSYGDGCDVFSLTVTEQITKIKTRQSVKRFLNSKRETSYQKYLRWREIIATEPPMRPRTEPASAVALHRDRKCGLALCGSECKACGAIHYPVQRICMECKSKDNFDYYPFAEKQGKIATFSHDNLAVSPDPPSTLAAVDFEEGGRIMMDVTDRDPSEIKVGMPLEMTFRKFRQTQGVQVYWWKSRPIR